jgi:hypothetical protein
MNISDAIYAFVLGAAVALLIVAAHIIGGAIKRECHDVGIHGRNIEKNDPVVYSLLYRAKQHAILCRKPPPGDGLKGRMGALYSSFQPDSRYLRLERNLAKLTDPTMEMTHAKRLTVLTRCQMDLGFLAEEPRPIIRHNVVVGMLIGIVRRLILPVRDGVTETSSVEARDDVKRKLEIWIEDYASAQAAPAAQSATDH